MVEAMGRLIQAKGYHATGLNELVATSGAPKGSLYHYFPGGKEQIAAEAIRASGSEAAAATRLALESKPTASAGLRALVEWLATTLETSGYRYGCPIATTTLEIASDSPIIQEACRDSYAEWLDAIVDRLIADGSSRRAAVPRATLVLAALEGALVLSRAEHSTRPLRILSTSIAKLIAPQ